jgi:tetratricopeptide (TPR) repeat protein
MKNIRRVLGIAAVAITAACLGVAPMRGQGTADTGQLDAEKIKAQIDEAVKAVQNLDMSKLNTQVEAARKAMEKVRAKGIERQILESEDQILAAEEQIKAAERVTKDLDMGQIQEQMERAAEQVKRAQMQMEFSGPALDGLRAGLGGLDIAGSLGGLGLAFSPFQQGVGTGQGVGAGQGANDAAQRQAERQQQRMVEAQQRAIERVRDAAERGRDSEQQRVNIYRNGTDSVDEGRYEGAIKNFDHLIEVKWSRNDGVYYWKAYALNKLGKRDEAQAALAEIPKQFPQSRWISDAKALQVEIQQSAGRPVSPDSIDDQDLKLVAINALMNSDAERAVPLLEKVLNDPKNNLSLKAKALFVLAQSRSEKSNDRAREIVASYAKSGSNPDLQIRAIGYLGTWRSKDSQQILADIYAANNDLAVRRAVLRGLGNSRDSAHLFAVAKTEQNADLRREAIRDLGNMQAVNELGQLYAAESTTELKEAILVSLSNGRASDKLLEIAKTEKNAELRGEAIRYLGNGRGDKSGDTLVSLYSTESDKAVKAQIIRTLGSSGAGKQLVDVTRGEKDPELKKDGVEWLGRMRGSKEATDYLMELISK